MGWMDWIRDVERERDVLERILATLIALAGLCDRLSGAPASVRLHVLGALMRAEAEARVLVSGMANEFGAPADAAEPSTGQADRLAASFRTLALALGAMLAQARRFARWLRREAGQQPSSRARQRDFGLPENRWPLAIPSAPDTS